jgi:trigger factor
MTAESTAERDIQVETAEEGAVVRRVSVEVAPRRVDRAFDRAYKELGRGVQVRGFRRGKVPRSVLERLYGESVGEDIERMLVADTLPEALELAELAPVTEPVIEAGRPQPGESFRYSARIEVKPAIELPELAGLPAVRPPVAVADEEVERELETLRERNAPLIEEPEDATAAQGHFLNLNFTGRIDGREFQGGSARDVVVEIGGGRMLPGFEDQLVGARAGEEREVRVSFPADHPSEELRGREAVFQVSVLSIRRRELPALDDEFAKDLGDFESLEALRERIRADLLARRERESQNVFHRTLLDSLVERAEFEVPPGLVEQELQHQLRSLHRQFEGRMSEEVLHGELSRVQEEGRPAAERRVRETLLLEAVADAEGLQVSDEEVAARLGEIAAAQGVDAARIRKLAREQDWEPAIRAELRERKALDFLAAGAKVEEKSDS